MSDERNTAREIAQDKMNTQIMYDLGEIKGTMVGIKESIDTALAQQAAYDKRLIRAEGDLSGIKIKIGIIGAVIGAFFSAIGDWLWRKIVGHQP